MDAEIQISVNAFTAKNGMRHLTWRAEIRVKKVLNGGTALAMQPINWLASIAH